MSGKDKMIYLSKKGLAYDTKEEAERDYIGKELRYYLDSYNRICFDGWIARKTVYEVLKKYYEEGGK